LLWQDYVQWGYVNHRRLDLPGYECNTLNVTTLRRMREVMDEKGWIASDVKKTVENLEEYFYFNLAPLGSHSAGSTNLVYVYWYVKPYTIQRRNVDSIFSNFTRTQKLYGGGVEETELIRGFLQSWGIASDSLNRHDLWTTEIDHNYNIFFDPETRTWRAYTKQLELLDSGATMSTVVGFFFYRPGFDLKKFCHHWNGDQKYQTKDSVVDVSVGFELRSLLLPSPTGFSEGVSEALAHRPVGLRWPFCCLRRLRAASLRALKEPLRSSSLPVQRSRLSLWNRIEGGYSDYLVESSCRVYSIGLQKVRFNDEIVDSTIQRWP